MASSKLMASSASSRNSDLRRASLSKPDFYNFTNHKDGMNLDDGFLRIAYGGAGEAQSCAADASASSTALLNAEIKLLDAAGAIEPFAEAERSPPLRTRTAEAVWREIVTGRKANEPPRRVECKEEAMDEMMTLEDFLVKAGVVEESAVSGTAAGEVKVEALAASGPSGGLFSFENPYMARHGSMDSVAMGYGSNGGGGIGGARGKRRAFSLLEPMRASSLLEPMDKAAAQRQRRMIKNRESAARSRERKQAYQVELEAMAVKLEEEHELLLKEKADRMKERCKLLLEKLIPVEEKRRPARTLRRVRSMEW